MSLKQEIESWVEALEYYDNEQYENALEIFEQNADTSKIYFNIGMIHATLGQHERAVESYARAVKLDSFLAVAYFQMGVSNFLLGEFAEAMANFNESLLYLRGNTLIDYEQLGLKFKLYSCEVLFNRGLCYIYNEELALGMTDMEYAAKEKQVEDHNVIDEAIKEQAEGYTVFSVGVGVLYRPNESKVRNVKTKDYLGKARLVAASDAQNAFTGFTGVEVKKQEMAATAPLDDRPAAEISFAASNLVKADLTSRIRAEEAPAPKDTPSSLRGERQAFPPTPPPENEFSANKPMRANTVANMGGQGGMGGGRSPSTRGRDDKARDESRNRGDQRDRLDPTGYGPPPRRPTVHAGVPIMEPRRAYSSVRGAAQPPVSARSRSVRAPSQQRGEPPQRPADRSDRSQYSDEYQSNPYNDDVYDLYGAESREPSVAPSRRGLGSVRRGPSRRAPPSSRYEEDEEYASDAYEGSSFDEDEFEMLDSRSMRSGASRRIEVKKIKVKAHGEDTRMIMITTGIEYNEFVQRLKEKFGFQGNVRCKIRDEDGDGMISVSDQEDLDMAISSCKKAARREKSEFGKLEIWVQEAK
ncbi:hypothetical protein BZA05DRAFT_422164 [Tricharina praecox]|uniref:uncharacterized protein n=1 Tax=Tricharina praecox TaxID=43433 RepID=UPI002220EB9D|nr:uncharacterized protein BZA05DRAFT_422164 [Tricharina praecox]KAI5843646.1 hypothetical protein BZA05DRAFT_422164 [Tricharina praecox]